MLPRGGQQLIGRESGEIEGRFLLSEKQQQIKPTNHVYDYQIYCRASLPQLFIHFVPTAVIFLSLSLTHGVPTDSKAFFTLEE